MEDKFDIEKIKKDKGIIIGTNRAERKAQIKHFKKILKDHLKKKPNSSKNLIHISSWNFQKMIIENRIKSLEDGSIKNN